MVRKLALVAATAAALGTAALAPTSASAWVPGEYHHHWHGGWWGPGYHHHYGAYGYGYGCRRWVHTPWGPRLRWVC